MESLMICRREWDLYRLEKILARKRKLSRKYESLKVKNKETKGEATRQKIHKRIGNSQLWTVQELVSSSSGN